MSKYNFSTLVKNMKSSKIRELMKYASMPDVISFGGGSPDSLNLPFEDVKNIINNWDNKRSQIALQYGTTEGFYELIDMIIQRMKNQKKINIENQSIVVTTGGQQGIFLVSRVLLDINDVVLVEEPSFIGAMASFLSCQAKLVGVKINEDGVDLDDLESKFLKLQSEGKTPKFFYTIPNFHNPKGSTLSFEKRKKLYELSKKLGLVVLEDDPYGDLFYEGKEGDYLPVKSYGNDAPIIYCSSFSKVLSPGFRLGWVLGDKEIIDKVSIAKQSVDACSNSFGQVIATDYLKTGKIENYLEKMRKIYKEKRDFMLRSLEKYFPSLCNWTKPKGGFFIYVDLPEGVSAEKLFMETIKDKVAFVTGDPFHTDPIEGDKHIRLSFSNVKNEDIEKGIEIIGNKIKSMIK